MSDLTEIREGHRFRASVLKFFAGSVGAQVVVVLSAPLLTRLYTSDQFGIFGVVVSVVAVGSTLATLRYEMAIALARPAVARYLFWGVSGASVITCLIASGVIQLWPAPIQRMLPTAKLSILTWLFPLAIFVHAIMLGAIRVAAREDVYGRLALGLVAGRAIDVLVKILVADLGWVGLTVGMVVGDAIVVLALVGLSNFDVWKPPRSLGGYLETFRRFRRFPLYNLPAALSSILANGLPVIILALLFDASTAGLMELSRRVLGRPSSLLGNRFYTVFYQSSVSSLNYSGTVAGLVERILPVFVIAFAAPFLAVIAFGPSLFSVVFGSQWAEAGRYAAILAPAWYLRSVATPIRLFNTFERQSLELFWQLGLLAVVGAAFFIGQRIGGVYPCLVLLSSGTSAAYLLHLAITIRLSGASYVNIAKSIFSPIETLSPLLRIRPSRKA